MKRYIPVTDDANVVRLVDTRTGKVTPARFVPFKLGKPHICDVCGRVIGADTPAVVEAASVFTEPSGNWRTRHATCHGGTR